VGEGGWVRGDNVLVTAEGVYAEIRRDRWVVGWYLNYFGNLIDLFVSWETS